MVRWLLVWVWLLGSGVMFWVGRVRGCDGGWMLDAGCWMLDGGFWGGAYHLVGLMPIVGFFLGLVFDGKVERGQD